MWSYPSDPKKGEMKNKLKGVHISNHKQELLWNLVLLHYYPTPQWYRGVRQLWFCFLFKPLQCSECGSALSTCRATDIIKYSCVSVVLIITTYVQAMGSLLQYDPLYMEIVHLWASILLARFLKLLDIPRAKMVPSPCQKHKRDSWLQRGVQPMPSSVLFWIKKDNHKCAYES